MLERLYFKSAILFADVSFYTYNNRSHSGYAGVLHVVALDNSEVRLRNDSWDQNRPPWPKFVIEYDDDDFANLQQI
jgi:hypothetical protein